MWGFVSVPREWPQMQVAKGCRTVTHVPAIECWHRRDLLFESI